MIPSQSKRLKFQHYDRKKILMKNKKWALGNSAPKLKQNCSLWRLNLLALKFKSTTLRWCDSLE